MPTRSLLAGTTKRPGTAVGMAASRIVAPPVSTSKRCSEARFDRNAETRRGVALRIEIEDQHLLADRRQRRAEIDGRRRLADAALLVGDRDDTRTRMCTTPA